MNVCVAHLQMNVCVAKNFGAWTEKVGHPWSRAFRRKDILRSKAIDKSLGIFLTLSGLKGTGIS